MAMKAMPMPAKILIPLTMMLDCSSCSASSLSMAVSSDVVRSMDESIRNDLQNLGWLGHKFLWWLIASAVVVAVGVALEGPEIFHEIAPVVRSCLLRPPRSRRTKPWIKVVGLMGWLLVVIGVIGEGVFEGFENRAEGLLQTFNDILLSDAQKQAGDAKTSALGAADASTRAQNSATAAGLAAGKAKAEADAVATKAEELHRRLATAETQLQAVDDKRAELEKSLINVAVCSAPRIIPGWAMTDASGKPTSVIDPLKPSAGRHVLVEFVPFDSEARRATLNLAGALESAGWIIDKVTTAEGIDDGVAILPYQVSHHILPEQGAQEWEDHVQAMKAGDDLAEFLHSYNWQAVSRYPRKSEPVDDIPHGGMKIEIGLYPAVQFVTPPGEKGFAESVARSEQAQQEEMKKLREQQNEKEEEAIKKLHLRPQEESELRNRMKEEEAEEKVLVKRYSQPCQPVIGGGIISPTNP
jgi:hypothetical protein